MPIICIYIIYSKYSRKEDRNPMHIDHITYGCKEFSYTRSLPPSYEMYPTDTRKSLSSTEQTTVYPFSEASSTYNTVNNCLSIKDHIYECTFVPTGAVAAGDNSCEDTMSENKYFVLDPKLVQPNNIQ